MSRVSALLRTAWLALPATLVLSGTALAQDRTASPHGDLPAGLDCSACHTSAGWRTLKARLEFDHARVSRFALTGAHATTKCAACHLDLRFDAPRVAEGACASCHADVHQGRIAGPCARCHDTRTFHQVPAIALHARAGFPLSGAHLDAPCESCHRNDQAGAFTGVPQQCVACHREDYAAALMPNHMAAGFPTDCQACHATVTWKGGAAFDHTAVANGFALVGAHAMLSCESCHLPPNMALRFTASGQNDCISCHRPQFDQAHGGGFPATCMDCHSMRAWSGATFDHGKLGNGFALVGAHTSLPCTACHVEPGNVLRFTPAPAGQNDCVACHQAQFNQAHGAGSGFPLTCADCHNVSSWSGATFDHAAVANGFALVGAHTSLACTACHIEPGNALKFNPAPSGQNDCYACHQAEFNQAHGAGSGFPTTCADCHTVNSWSGATFDHSQFFPLSGAHDVSCATCHTTQGDYTQFACLTCHTQTQTNQQHQGVSGYTYSSQACYSCHRNGRGGD
jgi:hypothetical protein